MESMRENGLNQDKLDWAAQWALQYGKPGNNTFPWFLNYLGRSQNTQITTMNMYLFIYWNNVHQCLSQDLETGCLKLAVV